MLNFWRGVYIVGIYKNRMDQTILVDTTGKKIDGQLAVFNYRHRGAYDIRIKRPCKCDPLIHHIYIVKVGYTGVFFVLVKNITIFHLKVIILQQ